MWFDRACALFVAVSAQSLALSGGCSSSPPSATSSTFDGGLDGSIGLANVEPAHEPESLALARQIATADERLARALTPAEDAWRREGPSSSFTSPGWRATENKEVG